jgi:putative hemolysin
MHRGDLVDTSKITFLALAFLAVSRGAMGVANPASVYCDAQGYDLEIRTNPETGGQVGYCVFPDGSACEEWDFYRGECGQNFTYCERQGYRIENRIEDMGTFTVEYAACVFDDCSECSEQSYFDGKCGPSNCSSWTLASGCKPPVEHSGLISKMARINNSEGKTAADVLGWNVTFRGEDGKCRTYYVAQAPLMGMTEAVEVECPEGARVFDSYMLDYEDAIAAMKSMRCCSTFVELSLYWPLTLEVKEPEWHIKTTTGNEIVIGANCGNSRC